MKLNKKITIIVTLVPIIFAISVASYSSATGAGRYEEPDEKPPGLSEWAIFNPETGHYYNSRSFYWDSERQIYVDKSQPIQEDTEPIHGNQISIEEWIEEYYDADDPMDVLLLEYREAMREYWEQHPELGAASYWVVGQDGGPFSMLTDLGPAGLPTLLEHVDSEDPFVIPVMSAITHICKTYIGPAYTSEKYTTEWRNNFYTKLNSATGIITGMVQEIAAGGVEDSEIITQFTELGIFALPAAYEEVMEKGNTALLDYVYYVLPETTLDKYCIAEGENDADVLNEALADTLSDIEVLRSLAKTFVP